MAPEEEVLRRLRRHLELWLVVNGQLDLRSEVRLWNALLNELLQVVLTVSLGELRGCWCGRWWTSKVLLDIRYAASCSPDTQVDRRDLVTR